MNKFLQTAFEYIYKYFSENSASMLVATGAVGWLLSSMAQISAIAFNNKISDKEKSFLIPQEIADAVVNITAFVGITLTAKNIVNKMFTTGKWSTPKVKQFLQKNIPNYENKIGKLDFCVKNNIKNHPELLKEHNTYSNFFGTIATVGGGIVATNIVTPILRNRTAANVQKSLMTEKENSMYKVICPKPISYSKTNNYSGSMRI